MIADNLKSVRQRILGSCAKCGRAGEDVKLVCVTKEASPDEINEVLALGVSDIGENRVQDAVMKHNVIGERISWHMVGHLQTNKVKDAVKIFSLIHSVDSARLALEIDKEAAKLGKVQDILVQVNTSGEGTKFGIRPAEVLNFIAKINSYSNISLKGLMTIAPLTGDPEDARLCFRMLKQLLNTINERRTTNDELRILSMGMTDDFEVAIEEGSNLVRIGRAIFRDDA